MWACVCACMWACVHACVRACVCVCVCVCVDGGGGVGEEMAVAIKNMYYEGDKNFIQMKGPCRKKVLVNQRK